MSFIDTIANFSFLGFGYWSYVIIFVAAILEAAPLLGLFIPGMTIVVAGGFMAKLGIINLGDVIVIASFGAILGDLIGYILGVKYGVSFLEKYGKYFFFRKKQFDKIKKLMNHHTGKSLILGRFNSLTRSFAPFIAGSTHTPFGRFLFFNIIGGIAWSIVFVMVGFMFGKSYEVSSKYIGGFITAAIIVGIGLILLYRLIDRKKHIFSKYHLHMLTINIFSLYIFAKMVEDVTNMELVTKLDIWLNVKVVSLWNPLLNEIMIFITSIASPPNLFLFSLFLFIIFIIKKKLYHATLLLIGMAGGTLLEITTKSLMHIERPLNALIKVSGYSFPSGHATIAIIFFTLILYAFKDDIKNKILKTLFIFSTIFAFLLVGLSRVYLNVHWFSDVLAGFALGLFWLTLLVLIFKFITTMSYKIPQHIKDRFIF